MAQMAQMEAAGMETLQAPFIYFGGKSRIADEVWARLGDPVNYVEPFAGSLAVLLARPTAPRVETVNDLDGMIANFWRAVKHAPELVAEWADNPVNENDLHARHAWLVERRESLTARLEGDPEFYDAKVAGWWVWGINCWIGSGWCSGRGPWVAVDGELVHVGGGGGGSGQGVNRKLPHLGGSGKGVNRKLPHLGNKGQCTHESERREALGEWFQALQAGLRGVRVCSGDWTRVTGPSVTFGQGLTAVFLDPPYADTAGRAEVYAKDCDQVAHRVREWAIAEGENPQMRIALCGYEGEHEMPKSWECVAWKARKGYGGQRQSGVNDNSARERIWFSPHCLRPADDLFAGLEP